MKTQQVRRDGAEVEIVDSGAFRIGQRPQILNIGDYCNECGNCATFCPTSGAPYIHKAKFHVTAQSFESARIGYHFVGANRLEYKDDSRFASLDEVPDGYVYENDEVKALLDRDYAARNAEVKAKGDTVVSLSHAVEMVVLFRSARQVVPLALSFR